MSRPGLIVGLGGTGQWVLTWLKRDLMLSHDGQMPSNVRLLAIDTNTQLEAGVRMVGGRQEEAVRLGNVTLGRGEFVYVGGDSMPLAERVKQGDYPNIGHWYHAQRWLDMMPPAAFVLDDGAGRIRQFGRMSIFKDILNEATGSRIWRALSNALDAVGKETSDKHRLEINVVGSFAGGTGSGMFIDIALLLRLMADQRDIHHVLRGFFALPSVFTSAPETDMLARTFAAWRELNRYMVVDSDFPMPVIEYVQDHPRFRTDPKKSKRIFDACYLVDSKRGGTPIASEAKNGVHPMVAEIISALLDEYAGNNYTDYVFTNLAGEYARTPEVPLYSTLGAYTVQVPAHFKQEVSTHFFTQELLMKLLSPRDPKLAAQGALRRLELAAPDRNLEIGPFPGRSRSGELLSTTSVTYKGETAKPTRFTARVDDIHKTASERGKREAIINALARAGGAAATKDGVAQGWVGHFTDLGTDPTFEQLRKNVANEVSFGVVKDFTRTKNQAAEEARDNMRKIPELVRSHLGGMLAGGQEFYGTFGDRLREAKDFHIELFRRIVRLRLLEILNGQTDQDQIKAKSGKIGYAWDYFDGLVVEFDEFLQLMQDVKRRREQLKPELRLQGLTENARKFMEQKTNEKLFWFWEAPVVKRSEDAFLQAQQRAIDLRKEDILHMLVVETVQEMKNIATETRDALQSWIWHLSTGDDPSQVPGLWSNVAQSLKNVNTDHSYDTTTTAVQRLIATMPPEVSQADIAAALKQWEWLADYVGTPPRLNLLAQILPEAGGERALTLTDPGEKTTMEWRLKAGWENQQNLMTLGRRRYAGQATRATVSDAIQNQFPSPEDFSGQVADGAEPLFDSDVKANPRRKSNMIRVQAPENDQYFYGANGLEGILREEQNLPRERASDIYNIRVVNSENPYKLTLVRTDDLIQVESFKAWRECLEAYKEHIKDQGDPQDPVLMHNFSAEAQAVAYERDLVRANRPYAPLHPRVVMLLEDPLAFRQFLYLTMLGKVLPPESDQRPRRWTLSWERDGETEEFWLTRGYDPDRDRGRAEPDMINAIHGYGIRRESWDPNSDAPIDHEFASESIRAAQREMGRDEEIKMLEENLNANDPNALVGWLRGMARQRDRGKTVERRDYSDLANVIEMILKGRLDQLRKSQKEGTSSGPFGRSRLNANKPVPPPVAPSKPAPKIESTPSAEPATTSSVGRGFKRPETSPFRPPETDEDDGEGADDQNDGEERLV